MVQSNPPRCSWVGSDPLYIRYHDEEWGVPCHDERKHFMYLTMECLSCGLSWLLMLKKREVFSQCFAAFCVEKVAAFTPAHVQRILATPGMIRSEQKVRAVINNAQCFLKVQAEWGTFDRYLWHFTHGITVVYPEHAAQPVTRNELSDLVASDMKQRGFKYVGSTIIYSHLQGIGVINDHESTCYKHTARK